MGRPYEERREAARVDGARGAVLADAALSPRRGRGAARGERAPGPRGRRREAARQPLRARAGARPAWIKVKNKQRQRARDRRLAAGEGPRGAARRAAGRLLRRAGEVPLRRPRRDGLRREGAHAPGARCWRRSRASGRRSRASAGRGARTTSSRAWSPRSSSPSGRTTADAAPPVVQGPGGRRAGDVVLANPAHQGESAAPTADGRLEEAVARQRRDRRLAAARPEGRAATRSRSRSTGARCGCHNLDKVMYPKAGFTKRDLIDYYVRIAPVLLPHLHDRPLTLKRYPDGVEGKYFYEKQCPSHRPDWVQTAAVWSRHNKTQHRLLPRQRPADAGVGGEPRRHRAAHVAVARRGRRRGRR